MYHSVCSAIWTVFTSDLQMFHQRRSFDALKFSTSTSMPHSAIQYLQTVLSNTLTLPSNVKPEGVPSYIALLILWAIWIHYPPRNPDTHETSVDSNRYCQHRLIIPLHHTTSSSTFLKFLNTSCWLLPINIKSRSRIYCQLSSIT